MRGFRRRRRRREEEEEEEMVEAGHSAGLHLRGLNFSKTYTEMVHLLPHSYLLIGSEAQI